MGGTECGSERVEIGFERGRCVRRSGRASWPARSDQTVGIRKLSERGSRASFRSAPHRTMWRACRAARARCFEHTPRRELSFAKTTAPLLGGHRDCLESWSPDDRHPGGTRLAGLRTLARMSAALDGHRAKATCVTSGCAAFVTVVQAADFRECDHAAFVWSLHAAWRGR